MELSERHRVICAILFALTVCVLPILIMLLVLGGARQKSEARRAREQQQRRVVCGDATVVSIGGCSSHGYCGVVLTNGHKVLIRYPVLGQKCDYEQ